ncbi:MAG: bacteriohemerythrin [Acidobacteriota bacterium]
MPEYNWDASYSVGVDSIDVQHQKLFKIINNLNQAMLAGNARSMVDGIVAELKAYTIEHFTEEERLMTLANYSDLINHKKLHQDFIVKVSEMQQKLNEGKMLTLSIEVMDFIGSWLINHIKGVDKLYTQAMKDSGI